MSDILKNKNISANFLFRNIDYGVQSQAKVGKRTYAESV